ncbi:MAG: M50 family metallopeptidase [Anaerolineaceae bacterium]
MSDALIVVLRILEFIILFGFLLFTHELGHFLVARLSKIEVDEFGFGFPPKITRIFRLWGTDFTLNAIPFGGFVRLKGDMDPNVPGGMGAAKPIARLGVLLGGPIMNILTGVLIFSIIFSQVGVANQKIIQIMGVNENSPAAVAGFLVGDVVQSINNEPIDSMSKLSSLVYANLDKEMQVVVLRNNEEITYTLTPRSNPPQGEGPLGITMGNPVKDVSWFEAVPYGFVMAYDQAKALIELPGQLIAGSISPEQARLVGPVGMFNIFSQTRDLDQEEQAAGSSQPAGLNSMYLLAVLAVALGLTNLLPIPALDGGRILFLLPELLFRKRIPPKYENLVNFIGFSLLIVLMLYITAQDIFNPIALP